MTKVENLWDLKGQEEKEEKEAMEDLEDRKDLEELVDHYPRMGLLIKIA